jgi:antitoxin YefM
MQAYSYSETRNRLKAIMDIVCKNGETVIVTRKDGQNVVMMSLDDFNSIQETIHLLSSRRNAERLHRSLREVEEDRVVERKLIE